MIIRKMKANFGTLNQASLTLSDGLNIIEAPNESGKSTWCAFVRTMLYGVNTAEQDRKGHLADKNRYKPWDGSAMEGTMELETEEGAITMQRVSQAGVPMKKLTPVYTGTFDKVEALLGDNPGQVLTGVSQAVFERTAFIGQSNVRVSRAGDLEKSISAIVSGNDDQSSVEEVEALMGGWLRRLQYNKTGKIPVLEARLEEKQAALKELERRNEQLSELRAGIDKTKRDREQLEKDLETHAKLEERDRKLQIVNAANKAKESEAELRSIETELTRGGRQITREDLTALRSSVASLGTLREGISRAQEAEFNAQRALETASGLRSESVFNGLKKETVTAKCQEVAGLAEAAAEKKKMTKPLWLLIVLTVLVAAAAGATVLGLLVWHSTLLTVVGIAVAVAALAYLIYSPEDTRDKEKYARFLESSGLADADRFREAAEAYTQLCDAEEDAKVELSAAQRNLAEAKTVAQTKLEAVLAQFSEIIPEAKDMNQIPAAVAHLESLLEQRTKAEFNMVSARNVYETMTAGTEEDLTDIDYSYLPPPLRSREDTVIALEKAGVRLQERTEAYNLARGELRALGDPAVLSGEIASLEAELQEARTTYRALELSLEGMKAAGIEMQKRVSPVISRLAGELLNRMTDGKYQSLVFDTEFNAAAKNEDGAVGRAVESLSAGTSDQIYLALRLAMCELLLSGERTCPIILDDALTNFDTERMHRALDLLREMAENRQIILFTCHAREREYAAEFSDVNTIRL